MTSWNSGAGDVGRLTEGMRGGVREFFSAVRSTLEWVAFSTYEYESDCITVQTKRVCTGLRRLFARA